MTNEEYLDSLLSSAQSNYDPQSALSRMSSKGGGPMPEDTMADLVANSNGNSDIAEIGDMLNKLDEGEFVDSKMADLLDNIEKPSKAGIPKFTVGNAPSSLDVRDPEEIALDEAIADAERLDAEIQSGKFGDQSFSDAADSIAVPDSAAKPIVDLADGDDASLEMAPEEILPEEKIITAQKDSDSDAKQTPEEILTDLLDDMPGDDLAALEEADSQESLSEALDNIHEEELEDSSNGITPEEMAQDAGMEDFDLTALEESMRAAIDEKDRADEAEIEETPLAEEAPLTEEVPEVEELPVAEELPETEEFQEADTSASSIPEEMLGNLDDIMAGMAEMGIDLGDDVPAEKSESTQENAADENFGFTFDGGDPQEAEPEAEETKEAGDKPAEEDEFNLDMMEMELNELSAGTSKASDDGDNTPGLDEISDDFNLNELEASLDDLLGGEEGSGSEEGEVAETMPDFEGSPEAIPEAVPEENGDVSMPDLDALMNSLANDEIEDIENTAHIEADSGSAAGEDVPKDDILEALTEGGFDDLGEAEPSLDELASIPNRSSIMAEPSEEEGDGKKKKKKKGWFKALLEKFFAALVKEDEEPVQNGELASLTDENQQVLNELGDDKKKKKEKKPKKEKPKKEKPKKEKPKKEKKPPKPKKEKKPKPQKDPGAPEKAISPKKVAISFIFAASLGILICIPAFVLPEKTAVERAKLAFDHEDYVTAYRIMYGREMTPDQQLMYEQARTLAWSERYLNGYENYVGMNMKVEALDMLLMAMRNKEELLADAAEFEVEIQVQNVYDIIESLLSQKYGLDSEAIEQINTIKKDRDYTIRLMEIVGILE